LKGIDFKPHDEPRLYREAVHFIKRDPLSLGGLVTTHKIDLYKACRQIFDSIDPHAEAMGEISSILKRSGNLYARVLDPESSGLALEAFLPPDHWRKTGAEVFILGAGGSARALTWHLAQRRHGANRPSAIHVADVCKPRVDHLKKLHASWNTETALKCHLVSESSSADSILGSLKPGSLIVNATGLGKDAPGSPLSDQAKFPMKSFAWEFNYRGD